VDLVKLYDDLTQIRTMIDDPNVPEFIKRGKQKLTNLRKTVMEQIQRNAISDARIIRTLSQEEYQEIVDEIRIAIANVNDFFKEFGFIGDSDIVRVVTDGAETRYTYPSDLKPKMHRDRIIGQLGIALEKLGEDH